MLFVAVNVAQSLDFYQVALSLLLELLKFKAETIDFLPQGVGVVRLLLNIALA